MVGLVHSSIQHLSKDIRLDPWEKEEWKSFPPYGSKKDQRQRGSALVISLMLGCHMRKLESPGTAREKYEGGSSASFNLECVGTLET